MPLVPYSPLVPCFVAVIAALPAIGPGQTRNNVLLILADDVGVDNVGAYGVGSAPPPTPIVDSLARRGVLFRRAWSNPIWFD